MGLTDYASDLGGNTIKVNCYNLPDNVFLEANKTKNVIRFSVMSTKDRKQMKPGSPDIKITELTGRTRMITRKELLSNYVLINGAKIKPYILKNGKDYMAYSRANTKYKIFKIPENMIGDVGGRVVPSGNYVVYEVDANGNIDRKTMAIVKPSVFRKMFKVPNQKVLQEHKLDTPRHGFSIFRKYQKPKYRDKLINSSSSMRPVQLTQSKPEVQQPNRTNVQPQRQAQMQAQPQNNKFVPNQSRQFSQTPMGPNINTVGGQRATTAKEAQVLNKQFMSQNPNANIQNGARFAIINRVVNLSGQLVGYTILDKMTNSTNVLNENNVFQLAASGALENVTLVTNNTGKRYLRGTKIVLDQLPKVIQ